MRVDFKKFVLSSLFFTTLAVTISANQSYAASTSYANAYQFGSNQSVGVSALMRTPSGVSFSVDTYSPGDGSVLDGHMITIWLVVFNEPEYCSTEGSTDGHPACSLDDVMNVMSGGPNTPQIDILYGTGHVVGNGSQAHFAGFKKVDDLKKSTFSIGLVDAQKAEVHLVVRSHGPLSAGPGESRGNVAESIGSFIGGCGGIPWFSDLGVIPVEEGQCNDIFYSVHLP